MKNGFIRSSAKTAAVILVMCVLTSCGNKKTEPAAAETERTTAVQVYYDTPATDVEKTEMVFVNLSNTGAVNKVNVSDWIHTDTAGVVVTDKSDLTGITNVKSFVEPVYGENGTLYWHMNVTDLYYSGSSTKGIPFSVKLSYFLDGVEYTDPSQMVGKSGNVTIKIRMTNNCYSVITNADGSTENIYIPMLVAGGCILSEGNFSGISVKGGLSLGDGSKQICMVLGLPGMSESLGLDEIDLGEMSALAMAGDSEITAYTDSFELGNMYFAAIPLCAFNLGFVTPDSISGLTDEFDSVSGLISVLTNLDFEEVGSLLNTFAGSADNIAELTPMIDEVMKLYNNNKVVLDLLKKYMTEENIALFTRLLEGFDSDTVSQLQSLLSNPLLSVFISDMADMSGDIEKALPILKQLAADMSDPQVKAALDSLPETLETLQKLSDAMDENSELIAALGELASSTQLSSLLNVADTLNNADLSSLIEKYEGLVGNTDALLERAERWVKVGSSYKIYSDAAQDTATTLLFICKTDIISK